MQDFNRERLVGISLLLLGVVAAVLGLYARFKGLGTWSLATDEYHTAQSINNILNKGIPAFDCGGYYTRGLIFQYLNALVLSLGNFGPEITMRLVTVITSLFTLPALYLITKKHGNIWLAIACLSLFFLSVWEIETARYIRMYAPFQALFVWYLYFFYEYMERQSQKHFAIMLALSSFSIILYEAGVFLLLLNFLALIQWQNNRLKLNIAINSIALVFAIWFFKTKFRFLGVENSLPSDIALPSQGSFLPVEIPHVLLTTMPFGSFWFIGFSTFLILSAVSTFIIIKNKDIHAFCRILILVAILSCVANQFLFAASLALICILLNWCKISDFYSERLVLFSITGILFFIFWLAYGASTDAWYHFFDDTAQKPLRKLGVVLIKYPDIHFKVIHQWFAAMPITSLLLTLVITAGTIEALLKGYDKRKFFLISLSLIVILCLWVAMLKQPYDSARYTLFLYPLIMIVFCISIYNILSLKLNNETYRNLFSGLFVLVFIVLADDYNFKHILNVDKAEYNFRDVYDLERGGQLFYRLDYKTPAITVNNNKKANDIVISTLLGVHYYLDKIDYMFVDYQSHEFSGLSTCAGQKELWTNADLIYKQNKLLKLLESSKQTIWLIARSKHFPYTPKFEKTIQENYAQDIFYTSLDKDFVVYKINPLN